MKKLFQEEAEMDMSFIKLLIFIGVMAIAGGIYCIGFTEKIWFGRLYLVVGFALVIMSWKKYFHTKEMLNSLPLLEREVWKV